MQAHHKITTKYLCLHCHVGVPIQQHFQEHHPHCKLWSNFCFAEFAVSSRREKIRVSIKSDNSQQVVIYQFDTGLLGICSYLTAVKNFRSQSVGI